MKIIIRAKNIELNQAIKKYIQEKLNSLEKFAKIFNKESYFNGFFGKGKPRTEAWVEIEKETLHHRKGLIFRAECQMRFPHKSMRATASSKDLRLAITEIKDELQRQLKQYKEKIAAKTKRGQRVLKRKLKVSPEAKVSRKEKKENEEI